MAPSPPSATPAPLAAPAVRPYRRALVVANPWAGRGKGQLCAESLARGLEQHAEHVDLHLTSARRDGFERVRRAAADTDLVVSVGGDGTLSEVLDGMRGRDVPVAQLPLGTANVLATELGLPRRVAPALDMIAVGKTTGLDAAEVGERLSFLCTGVGIDGMAVAEVESRRSGPIRKYHYATAMLRVLRHYRPPRLTLEIDGTPVPGEFGFVLVANVREYGAVFHLSKLCRRDDGLLEVYALPRASLPALLRLGLRGILRHLPSSQTAFWQAERIRITSPEPVPFQVDGDLGGTQTEIEVALRGARFRMIVP